MFKPLFLFEHSLPIGLSLNFQQDGSIITAWYSYLSGKEKLFVNEMLVTSRRNYGYYSRVYFDHEGHKYSIRLENPLTTDGKLFCTLSKNGKDVQRKKVQLEQNSAVLSGYCHGLLQLAAMSTLILTLCLSVGVLSAYFQWSTWLSYALVLVIVGFGVSQLCLNIYRQQRQKVNIEDDTLT